MKPTVLFVDDEPVRMSPFAIALERAGYQVIMAASAGEALELAKAHRSEISVLIVDIMIPTGTKDAIGIDPRRAGLWALGEIRAIPELAEAPAIVLSAVSETRVTAETERLGVVAYLEKPLSLARLVTAVDKALARLEKGGAD